MCICFVESPFLGVLAKRENHRQQPVVPNLAALFVWHCSGCMFETPKTAESREIPWYPVEEYYWIPGWVCVLGNKMKLNVVLPIWIQVMNQL